LTNFATPKVVWGRGDAQLEIYQNFEKKFFTTNLEAKSVDVKISYIFGRPLGRV
jgi:hypothetical protein